jgi:hypothetical protein
VSIADLIRKRTTGKSATATRAIPATQQRAGTVTVARVATIAVASPPSREAASLPDPAAEARRRRLLAMLEAHPDARYAALTDPATDPEAVILVLAIRGRATCELRIPREKWDGVLFLELLERHCQTVH